MPGIRCIRLALMAPCFNTTLERLAINCLERRSFTLHDRVHSLLPLYLPIYLLSVPWLTRRRALMRSRLSSLGAPDVTLVWCANRQDVEALDSVQLTCLHPYYVRTAFSLKRKSNEYVNAAIDPRTNRLQLFNGTLSLALKHRIAYRDMLRRQLRAALILEDDALVPSHLWTTLATFQLPVDADVFYVGSYSSRPYIGTLNRSPRVNGTSGPPVHVRVPMSNPVIIGANAYIIFTSGAETMLRQPVLAEADISLSLLMPTSMCGDNSDHCSLGAPHRQFGPAAWLAGQDTSDGGLTHSKQSCKSSSPKC